MKMTQEQFIELKALGIEQAKAKDACEEQLERAIDASTWSEMKNVICDNIWWCNDYDILVPDGKYKNEKRKFTVVNGKVNGKYVRYRDNGQVNIKCTYVNGKLHGKYVRYHDKGQVWVKCTYVNGKEHGKYVIYFDNGQVAVKRNYLNGKLHGDYVSYHDNGQVCVKCTYVNGKKITQKTIEMKDSIDDIRAVVLTQLHKDSLVYDYLKTELDKLDGLAFNVFEDE